MQSLFGSSIRWKIKIPPEATLADPCQGSFDQSSNGQPSFIPPPWKQRRPGWFTLNSFSMQELVIEPGHSGRGYWHDIWRFRELLYFLAWRDLLVRYKQTVVGVVWALIKPLLTMVILTVVFG